jgi:hypothetical protein
VNFTCASGVATRTLDPETCTFITELVLGRDVQRKCSRTSGGVLHKPEAGDLVVEFHVTTMAAALRGENGDQKLW